jgi:hypothetical protein
VIARLEVGTITGTVVDAKGAGVASARVYTEPQFRDTYTDDDGKFVTAIPQGTPVSVYAQGAIGQHGGTDGVRAGADIRVVLRSPGAIRVSCKGEGTERSVTIERRQGGRVRSARCGDTATSLLPDVYAVRGFQSYVEATVTEGHTTEVDLELAAASHVRFVMTINGRSAGMDDAASCTLRSPKHQRTLTVPARGSVLTLPRARYDVACKLDEASGRTKVDARGATAEITLDLR